MADPFFADEDGPGERLTSGSNDGDTDNEEMREELDSDSAATVSPESSAAASESEAESGSPSPVLREQSDGSQPQISGGESDDAESNSGNELGARIFCHYLSNQNYLKSFKKYLLSTSQLNLGNNSKLTLCQLASFVLYHLFHSFTGGEGRTKRGKDFLKSFRNF